MPLDVLVTACTTHHHGIRAALRHLVGVRIVGVVLVILTGCTTHHRFTVGPTYGLVNRAEREPQPGDPPSSPPFDVGVDAAGEVSGGGDNVRLLLAGAARAGFGVTGGGFRVGASLGRPPTPYGIRGTVSIGPTFVSDGTLLDVRGGLILDYGFATADENKRTTVGFELFASSVGNGGEHRAMIGIGISVGAYHHDSLGLAAAPPPVD